MSNFALSKVLLGSAVLAALAFGFVSCTSDDDDDDDNEMISGSGDDWSINYDNTTSGDTSRGYRTAKQNHLGAILQFTFNKETVDATDTAKGNGAMAFIWDLQSDVAAGDSRAAKELRRFCIAGVRLVKDGDDLKADPYVSYYTDVVDIQADNFGAGNTYNTDQTETTEGVALYPTEGNKTSSAYTAKEHVKFNLGTNATKVTPDGTTGAVTITVRVEPVDDENTYTKDNPTKFKVDFYKEALDESSITSDTTSFASEEITAKELEYSEGYLKQQSEAVYANVYGGKKLSGTWKYVKDYAEAEEVVE